MEKQTINNISNCCEAYTNTDSQICTNCGEICFPITIYCDNESYIETIKNLNK
jgi:uncharacterized OB-fold protein